MLFARFTAINTTNYPGSYGVAGYYKETRFNLISTPNPPTLGAPVCLLDGRFQFSITTGSGQNCTIQASTNLRDWDSLLTINEPTNFFYVIDPNAPNMPCRFYRVKIEP